MVINRIDILDLVFFRFGRIDRKIEFSNFNEDVSLMNWYLFFYFFLLMDLVFG